MCFIHDQGQKCESSGAVETPWPHSGPAGRLDKRPERSYPGGYCFLGPRWSASRGTKALSSQEGCTGRARLSPIILMPIWSTRWSRVKEWPGSVLRLSFLGWHGWGAAEAQADWEPPRTWGLGEGEGHQCIQRRSWYMSQEKGLSSVSFLPNFYLETLKPTEKL